MRNIEDEEWQAEEKKKEEGEAHAIERQLTFSLIKAYKVCTGSRQGA